MNLGSGLTNYFLARQPDGSCIPVERWLYHRWAEGLLRDPFLSHPLDSAVEIIPPWGEGFHGR